ncbi:hypothetical protein GO003_026000 [Methylicorpusculum oleiharenae]|uniref:hypothetical protein n=1 Tax=Methylicorpusculum oleiharenae TaxID=1338687 RepID=UPI00135A0324|nr:hypothetical protein [Methylicorpusculum oleiharenae]MCD2453832.1 hypothetical protein [Methylicorpusculum oleiharenae]
MNKKKCSKSKSVQGLYLKAFSGQGSTTICTIGTNPHLNHHVYIENLQLYDADISCTGSITSNPYSVYFDSGVANPIDTCLKWYASANLPEGGSKEFQHVKLIACGAGHENVFAEVSISWPDPNEAESLTVSIEVEP